MMILRWFQFHALRAFEFDRAWPWKKVYWTEMGDEDKAYETAHPDYLIPWRKTFWTSPNMKRFYSIILLMLGVKVFFIALILLTVAVSLLIQAIAG